jgi:hypothetical protein
VRLELDGSFDVAAGAGRAVATDGAGRRSARTFPAPASAAVTARGRALRVRARCVRAPTACRGRIAVRAGRRTLAVARYAIPPGVTAAVRLRTTRRGRAALARRRLRVVVRATVRDGAQRAVARRQTIRARSR